MNQVLEFITLYLNYIVLGLVGVNILLFILIIILFIKNQKLKKKYNHFMRGSQLDIEGLLNKCIDETELVKGIYNEINNTIDKMQGQIKTSLQKVGIVKYSALENTGADLSFAVALLDEENNGIVINGIYTRDGSYTYGKGITNGKSDKSLTDEEQEAINRALKTPL